MRASSRVSSGRRGSLPTALHALVGREADVAAVRSVLLAPETRLLTLTGPPGVGKTRLAIGAAAAVCPHFADGVVFVDLTAVRDPALVPGEVLGALGLPEATVDPARHLGGALAGREVLAVLDNFEHVLDAASFVAAVLTTCRGLRVLVTSRERLHLQAEREVPVHPLELPRTGDDPERTAAAPAVAMLCGQVRAFEPTFEVTSANSTALAEICTRLDGLPLALELAAARLRLFTPGELTFRLRHRMTLLTSTTLDVPERHRTLRAALAWSRDLLSPWERALFRRFSVFVGGATLDAVEHVCGVDDVVGSVSSLVDKSLVQLRTRQGDAAEFVMLESLREYAAEMLEEAGETAAIRARHARYYADLAARTEACIGTADEAVSVGNVGGELGNLRAAMASAMADGELALSLQLAAAIGWWCYTRGRLGEYAAMVDGVVAAADRSPVPVPERSLAAAVMSSAVAAVASGELDHAETQLRRCGELNDRLGDARRAAIVTAFKGHVARARGDFDAAVAHHEWAARLHDRLGNVHGVAWSRYDLGLLARRRGWLDNAAWHLRTAVSRFRESRYTWAIGCAAWALATVELRRGHLDDAGALLVEALDAHEAADDMRGLAQCLEAAAAVACARRQESCSGSTDAARLLGAASVFRERLAAPLPEEDHDDHDAVARHLDRDLGIDAADRARCAGRALSQGEAVALARRALAVPGGEPAPAEAGALTRREREVADLVARGRTNRQIARALGIAEKTAEVHVHNIIRKLGARNRAEVAAWVAARGEPV